MLMICSKSTVSQWQCQDWKLDLFYYESFSNSLVLNCLLMKTGCKLAELEATPNTIKHIYRTRRLGWVIHCGPLL
jgi:hypothetical protein